MQNSYFTDFYVLECVFIASQKQTPLGELTMLPLPPVDWG